ncbi:Uncharacterised protein [Mycolicibacterium fortuitum]|uniref:SnoaL-like domain-containing protein n=1 Tax=Mycolicibacterium fortuitum TaxID=1766 RepID=A0A378USP4_MYCFO|nr:Uncharacterised protein [Mycolicibacterium fortuitum]
MTELDDTVTAYLDTWNATDAGQRRALLERHWSRVSPTPIRWPR